MATYQEIKDTAIALLKVNQVPGIIGEAGIGKTAMVHSIAEDLGWTLSVVNASEIEPGDLALPTVGKDPDLADLDESLIPNIQKETVIYRPQYLVKRLINISIKRNLIQHEIDELKTKLPQSSEEWEAKHKKEVDELTEYVLDNLKDTDAQKRLEKLRAETFDSSVNDKPEYTEIQNKIKELEEKLKTIPRGSILFIDELTRASAEVSNALMNLIQSRTLGGMQLPDDIHIVIAANPTSDMTGYTDTSYSTTSIDSAVYDRIVWLNLDMSFEDYKNFGMKYDGKNLENLRNNMIKISGVDTFKTIDELPSRAQSRIHQFVLEYLSNNPSALLITEQEKNKNDFKAPTPRAWDRVSDALKGFEFEGKLDDLDAKDQAILFNMLRGNLGETTATSFNAFLNDKSRKPLPDVEEFMENSKEILPKNIQKELSSGNTFRKLMLFANVCNYISHGKPHDVLVNLSDVKKASMYLEKIYKFMEATREVDVAFSYINLLQGVPSDSDDQNILNYIFVQSVYNDADDNVYDKWVDKIVDYVNNLNNTLGFKVI